MNDCFAIDEAPLGSRALGVRPEPRVRDPQWTGYEHYWALSYTVG